MENEGFDAVGINAVAARAGVSKVLIYRYFGDLEGLMRTAAEQLRGITPDISLRVVECANEHEQLSPESLMRCTVLELRRSVEDNPLLRRLLVWELTEDNAMTRLTTELREESGLDQTEAFSRLLAELRPDNNTDVPALLALVTAGVFFLSLRSDSVRYFNGLDIRSDEGWQRIADAAADLMRHL